MRRHSQYLTLRETLTDAIGRVTNSVRAVWSGGSADPAYSPLETRTEYPYGTEHYRVTTDPLDVATISRKYYGNNCEIEETVSAGVTNRTTKYWGGATVEEKFWDGKWTRETRSTSYNAAGGRVETVVTESSDYPTVTNSVTVYDFLGRVVSVTAPLGVTSNFYDGASDRVIRMSRTGSPDTLYVYDALCNVAATALDADGDGQVSYTGTDRISASGTRYEEDTSNVWWRVTASAVWNQTGVDAGLTSAVTRVRMTGLGTDTYNGGILTAQTESIDWPGNVTRTSTYTDAANANVWTVTETPGSVQPAIQKTVAGHAVSMVSSTAVTNTCTYDGFARQTGATDGRGNTSLTVYNTLGQVAYTEDAASNRTAYAYDAFGRQNAVTPPLSNTVFTAYDSLGNVAAQWGGTYPVEHGYDSQGRRISMKTFRVANGAGDETRWLYDNATGLLTNKVYADNSRVSYTYTPSGRLASRVWARGVTTAYTYDALGQLSGIGYSDATPDITFAYDRLGRMTSAVTEVSSNLFEYSGLDLVGEIQNGEAIVRIYDSLGRSVGFNWATDYFVGYCYDALGRLVAVTSTVDSVTGGWGYGYLPGTDLIKGWVSDDGFVFDRTYENNRNLLSAVTNRFGTSLVGAFGYFNDEEARRTKRLDGTGVLAVTNAFGYNAYGELVSACTGTNTYGYGYDPIGNRISATNNAEAWAYVANAINQYAGVTGTVHVTPMYDADGNTVSFGEWTFVWDAENRLVTASNAAMVVANTYDYRSRRITKRVNNDETRFVYDGWALIGELKTTGTVSYVYGPDLSGALQGAGTVGGLLCRVTGNEAQHYAYDGNGNVVALVSVGNGSNAAKYEYCPFGETISATGSFAGTNPFRFSTKYFDAETGLLMYQLRPLILSMCRWLNRDPIEEKGGLNLYCFLKNNPIGAYDYLGLQECDCPSEKVDLKIAEMIRAAIKNTVKNPVSIDLNWDRQTSKWPYIVKIYREFGGFVCCDKKTGTVDSTGPFPGGWKISENGVEILTEDPRVYERNNGGQATMANILYEKLKQCPHGSVAVAFYHSHPSAGFNFSSGDTGWSDYSGLPIAGGGVSGKYFKIYNPKKGNDNGWEVFVEQ